MALLFDMKGDGELCGLGAQLHFLLAISCVFNIFDINLTCLVGYKKSLRTKIIKVKILIQVVIEYLGMRRIDKLLA